MFDSVAYIISPTPLTGVDGYAKPGFLRPFEQ
jgi:hypothetical protein